jgi:hypothetical protein
VIANSRNLNLYLEYPKQNSNAKELNKINILYLRLLKEKIFLNNKKLSKSKHLNISYFKIVTYEKDVDKINNNFSKKSK